MDHSVFWRPPDAWSNRSRGRGRSIDALFVLRSASVQRGLREIVSAWAFNCAYARLAITQSRGVGVNIRALFPDNCCHSAPDGVDSGVFGGLVDGTFV